MLAQNKEKLSKTDKERTILLKLVEHYLKTGKPVGSHTLKEAGLDEVSSATIRNYFAKLEEKGFLKQQHSSGGRIPTAEAFKYYANYCLESKQDVVDLPEDLAKLQKLKSGESKQIALFLQQAAESLAETCGQAVFLSAPRFDNDFVTMIKFVGIDNSRCLAILITDFGVIHTEIITKEEKLSSFSTKRIELYLNWRLTGIAHPDDISIEEEAFAAKVYNELMLRFLVDYSSFDDEDIYRTGFSKLLQHEEFKDPTLLAKTLSLFENATCVRFLLKRTTKDKKLTYWIGDDLSDFVLKQQIDKSIEATVVAIPYLINQQVVGAIGLLGPIRMDYPKVFRELQMYSEGISEFLTRNLFKYKIQFRQPHQSFLERNDLRLLEQTKIDLIEDQRMY